MIARFAARHWRSTVAALAMLMASGVALGCADEGLDVRWSLYAPGFGGVSRIVIGPGNDTRVNLLLLAGDRAGTVFRPDNRGKPDWIESGFGRVFIDWPLVRSALVPKTGGSDADTGSRCDGLDRAGTAFAVALGAAGGVPVAERSALVAARARLTAICGRLAQVNAAQHRIGPAAPDAPIPIPDWPTTITSPAGRVWLGYLQASGAFYAEDWDGARSGFAALTHAGEPWVAETASYMAIRVELAAALRNAFSKWGFFEGPEKTDAIATAAAARALAAYRKAWPQGRYIASADGLERRLWWFARDYPALGARYETMLGTTAPLSPAAVALVQEIDNTTFRLDHGTPNPGGGALLTAARDLFAMR